MLNIIEKIKEELQDTGAYEQEVNGKTEFLKGITYAIGVIEKYESEEVNNIAEIIAAATLSKIDESIAAESEDEE